MFKYEEKEQVVHKADELYMYWVDSYEKQTKNSIGKPCEGKLHARFDAGGADCFTTFVMNRVGQSGSTLLKHKTIKE